MPEHAAGIRQSVRVLAIARVEQNSYGLERLGTQNHDPSLDLSRLVRDAIDVEHTPGAVSVSIHQDLIHHCVWNVGAPAALQRIGHRGKS